MQHRRWPASRWLAMCLAALAALALAAAAEGGEAAAQDMAAVSGTPAPAAAAEVEAQAPSAAPVAAANGTDRQVSEEELCQRQPGMSESTWMLQRFSCSLIVKCLMRKGGCMNVHVTPMTWGGETVIPALISLGFILVVLARGWRKLLARDGASHDPLPVEAHGGRARRLDARLHWMLRSADGLRLAMHMVGSSPAELNIRHLCGVALHAAASALGLALRVLLSQVPYAFLLVALYLHFCTDPEGGLVCLTAQGLPASSDVWWAVTAVGALAIRAAALVIIAHVKRYGYIGWEHLASGMRAALTCARAAPIDAAAPASPAAASNPSLPSSPAQQGSRASPRGTAGDPETPRGAIVPALGSEAGTEPGSLLPPGPLSHTGPQGSADVGASSAVAQPGSSGGSLRHRAAARDGSAAGASSAGSSTATPAGSSEPEGSHTAAGAGQVGLQASFLWHHMARQHFMIATQRSATLQRSMRDEQESRCQELEKAVSTRVTAMEFGFHHTLLVLLARMVAACLLWYLAPAAGFELSLLAACEPELWSWVSRCWGWAVGNRRFRLEHANRWRNRAEEGRLELERLYTAAEGWAPVQPIMDGALDQGLAQKIQDVERRLQEARSKLKEMQRVQKA